MDDAATVEAEVSSGETGCEQCKSVISETATVKEYVRHFTYVDPIITAGPTPGVEIAAEGFVKWILLRPTQNFPFFEGRVRRRVLVTRERYHSYHDPQLYWY